MNDPNKDIISLEAVVCLEPIIYPGTTELVLRKVIEAGPRKTAGVEFHLASTV